MPLFSYTMVQLGTLIVQETKDAIYKTALGVATSIGLPVTTWTEGDPTRSLFFLEAELLAKLEEIVVGYIRSGFLDYAAEIAVSGDETSRGWLNILAKQQFNVDVPAATFATTSVVLSNAGANFYPDIAAGDLTFKNSTSGKTYRNTSGGTLNSGPGTTLTVDVEADEAGTGSSAAAGEIDELVTTLIGVTCTNPTAAVGVDEQDPQTTVQQCRDKLSSFSPNGPKGAYSYVARNPELSGTANITRTREYPDSDVGEVTMYLASNSGAVTEADRALVEAAVLQWATPLCITPTILSAVNVEVDITYQLWVYKRSNKTADEIKADVVTALETMFATRPIGGDIIPPGPNGKLYVSLIESTIRNAFPDDVFRVVVTEPAADTTLTNDQVAALGTVTATTNIVPDP